MTFSDQDKLKALSIVNIFETSRPFGDYAACVVLTDGAGVSYGINQFTHRSGSLAAVVETYLNNGGTVGREILTARLPILRWRSANAVGRLAADEQFKKALRAAAVTREMKEAQRQVAFERYLRPAIDICKTRGFVLPLSLAAVYDSVTHGSFGAIAARVAADAREKKWITEYIRKRHFWLQAQPPGSGDAETQGRGDVEKSVIDATGEVLGAAAEKFDRVNGVVTAVADRKDAAKSLWTTVAGTLWQTAWAIFGFFIGLPIEVWIVVAVIAAALMLFYLYRQILLGKIREKLKSEN